MPRSRLRPSPRFGFLTLFAAMLLFISGAGWAKWNVDLWREEEALLADLVKAGAEYSYTRGSGHLGARVVRTQQVPTLWDPLVPYFSRIEKFVFTDPPPSRGLVERAATLPYVRMVTVEVQPTRELSPEAIASKIGIEAPPLATPVIPRHWFPNIPDGEAIDADEASSSISAFLAAWDGRQPAPRFGTASSVTMMNVPIRTFQAVDDELRFLAVDGCFALDSAESSRVFSYSAAGFQQTGRFDDPESAASEFEKGRGRMIAFFPREALRANLEQLGIEAQFLPILRKPKSVRVARIDERRVRLDLPPVAVAYPSADCVDDYSISLLARTDLDWELEAWRIDGERQVGPLAPTNLFPAPGWSYRGTLRREQGLVVTEKWAVDAVRGPFFGVAANLAASRTAGLAKYDFSPDLDLSHVTPELFDARMLPPRRELPWLRWYRVTFGLSLGLFAFVAGRKLVARKRPTDVQPA